MPPPGSAPVPIPMHQLCMEKIAMAKVVVRKRKTAGKASKPTSKTRRVTSKVSAEGTIDLVFTFDTTGSMYPCLTQVRRYIAKIIDYLFANIPNLRIGIIAHGDHCDGKKIVTVLDLTNNKDALKEFVLKVPSTNGGDSDEAYEFVLNRARTMSWTAGKNKALVMIGDANPHKVGYRYGSYVNDLDWENEAALLLEAGIKVIPVQALANRWANNFYDGLSAISGMPKIELEQFADINDVIMALCMSRAGKIVEFEKTLEKRGSVSYSVLKAVDVLSGRKARTRKVSAHSKYAVHPSRFQVLDVDDDCDIKGFVIANDLAFKKGRGFYEFTKPETIQNYKEVVLQDRNTGEMFTGDKAREIAGIPIGVTARVKPEALKKYRVFVQSTSVNRKLIGGTKFLYEVEEWKDLAL